MLQSGAEIANGNRGAAETRPEISPSGLHGRALTQITAALRPGPAWRRWSEGAARRAVTTATRPKDAARRLAAKNGAADWSPLSRSPRARSAWGERAASRPSRPRGSLRARRGWAYGPPLAHPGAPPCRQGRGSAGPRFVTEAQRFSAARGGGGSLRPWGGERGRGLWGFQSAKLHAAVILASPRGASPEASSQNAASPPLSVAVTPVRTRSLCALARPRGAELQPHGDDFRDSSIRTRFVFSFPFRRTTAASRTAPLPRTAVGRRLPRPNVSNAGGSAICSMQTNTRTVWAPWAAPSGSAYR